LEDQEVKNMKIDKDIVESVLCDYTQIDTVTRLKIIEQIEREAEENKPEKVKKPKQHFVAVAITDNEEFENVPLFVVKIEEGDDHNTIIERIKEATAEHNNTPKGRKFPINTLGAAMGETKRKLITEKKVWVQTKEPILIVRTDKNGFDFSSWKDDE
jgi:hypothetical protein